MCAQHGSALSGIQDRTGRAVDHIGVSVHNLEGAIAFYTAALDLTEEFRFSVVEHDLDAVILRGEDGLGIELLRRTGSKPKPRAADQDAAVLQQGYGHFCLRVDDLQAAVDKLVNAGAGIVVPPSPAPHPAVRFAYLDDLEGNLIELIHVAAGVDLGAKS
jgi:catechol 2,3-dioxygenase-like lactoylglutathione lyase family enzyme